MGKFKYIPCDIYKRGITVFVGTLCEMKSWVSKNYTDDDEKDFVDMVMSLRDGDHTAASFSYNSADGEGIVLIPRIPNTPKEHAMLSHELLHAAFHLLGFCRVEFSYGGSNEPYAYLLEHLTRNALEKSGYEDAIL